MKAKDVMKILGITRQTLHNYIVQKYIRYIVKPNGDKKRIRGRVEE